MKHIFIVLFFITVSLGFAQNNSSIRGTVKEEESLKRLENITVSVDVNGKKQQTLTDSRGEFTLNNIPNGDVELIFASKNHTEKKLNVSINGTTDVGSVYLHLKSGSSIAMDDVISLSDEELDDESSNEAISGILSASNDVFGQATAYTFSSARFRRRGYGSEYSGIFLNGVPMNNMENGRAYWYLWGGLNDAVREKNQTVGLELINQGFGGFGGSTNINTKASDYRKGTKITYSNSNRSYTHRTMFIHSTGLMDNGWALTFSGSKRWGDEGYIDGTSYDAYGYFFSALKVINDDHSIGLTVLGAPSERGRSAGTVQAAYDLAGSNFYNPNWGYQDGDVRNARMQRTHQPIAILKHYWQIDDKSKLETSFTFTKGESGNTALNWINAADPRPDYYRKLPIYEKNYNNPGVKENFNPHINWQDLYNANQYNNPTGEARYLIEERRNDIEQYIANINYSNEINENIYFTSGVTYNNYIGHHFAVVEDLLGAKFLYDKDKFAERTNYNFSGRYYTPEERAEIMDQYSQSDLNNPDRKVYEGDTYNNNYKAHVNIYSGFAQAEFSYDRIDYFGAITLSNTSMWREGLYRKGLFKDNSYGDSKKLNFFNYGVKAGATYKYDGRNYFIINAGFRTKAPNFRNSYISPRTRHTSVDDLDGVSLNSEKVIAADLGYNFISDALKLKIVGYYGLNLDQVQTMGFYHDTQRTFVNSILTGVDKSHMGIELGAEAKLNQSFSLFGAAAVGQHKYNSNPDLTLVADNTNEIRVAGEKVYAKDFKDTGYPQQAYTAGIKYRSPNYMWISLNANYYREMYLSFNPYRRTDLVANANKAITNPKMYHLYRDQEQLDNAFSLDFNIGKSWRIDYKYYININVSVNNILDNKEFITGGYEQLRVKNDGVEGDVTQFSPKYYYAYGRNYFINLSFRF